MFLEKNDGAEYEIFLADEIDDNDVPPQNFEKITVPRYTCFVLGDNRNHSRDSRQFGPIPLTSVRGKFGYLYFPGSDWSRFGPVK